MRHAPVTAEHGTIAAAETGVQNAVLSRGARGDGIDTRPSDASLLGDDQLLHSGIERSDRTLD